VTNIERIVYAPIFRLPPKVSLWELLPDTIDTFLRQYSHDQKLARAKHDSVVTSIIAANSGKPLVIWFGSFIHYPLLFIEVMAVILLSTISSLILRRRKIARPSV
jgi:hypothetical protein